MSGQAFERVKEVLWEAQQLPGSERSAYLDRACEGDDALRSEVESLLPHGELPGLLDQGAPPVSPAELARVVEAAAGRASAEIPARVHAGVVSRLPPVLGRFRIVGLIARGGMGAVYEAEQDDPKRRVALKTLRPDLFSPSLARRFQLESRILGLLKHPGIAQVYEAGTVDDDGQAVPYFAMELVEGESILDWADAHEFDTDARLALFARVCDAVEHAHQRGVIHRDLKPDNILVTEDGHPKVLDFGVARVTDADIEATTIVTQAGQIMGTLAYMSPEQVSGDPGKLDLRSDVYALGVVLFELLSGQKPYDLARHTLPEATRIIHDEDATRLGSVDTRFRGDLETIVGTALEKDVGRRYVSAAALSDDIRRHQAQLPIGARPPSSFYQLRKFAQRHTGLVVGSATALLALVAGLAFSLRFAFDEARQRNQAEAAGYRALLSASMAALDDEEHLVARALLDEAPEALRGWEWHHAAVRAEPLLWDLALDLPPLRPHTQIAPAVAFSSDGRLLAALVADDRVDVFLAESGIRQHSIQLSGPLKRSCLAATAAGFVTMTVLGHVAHWGGPTGELLQEQVIPELNVSGPRDYARMAWDETSGRLAVAGLADEEPEAKHWVVRRGESLYVGPIGSIQLVDTGSTNQFPVGWTDDGQALVSSSHRKLDLGAMISDVVVDAAGVPTLRQRNRVDARLTYDVQGDRLLVAPAAGAPDKLVVIDFEGNEQLQLDPQVEYHVIQGAFSQDGRRIVTTSSDGRRRTVTVFDAVSGRALTRWPSPDLSFGALSPTGRLLAIGGPDRLAVLSLDSPATTVLPGADEYVYNLAWAPDGRTLWSRTFDLTSRGYDVAEGAVILDVPAPGPGITWGGNVRNAMLTWGLSAEGRHLVATHGLAHDGPGMTVSTHDYVSGGEWHELPGVRWEGTRTNGIQDLFALPRASRLEFLRATGAVGPSEAPLQDLAVTRRGGSAPRVHTDGSGQLLVGPVGTYIERVDGRGRVPLLIGGRALPFDERTPPPKDAKNSDVSFSPDGRLLAAVRPEVHEGAHVHDVRTGESVVELLTETAVVLYAVAFSPDGRRLAVGGTDRAVSLFDTSNWQLVIRLVGHRGYIKDIAWSPDGATLATAGGDGTVRLWHTNSIADRTMAARAAGLRREQQRPSVMALFEELDDPHAVAEAVRADGLLDADQRHAALRVVRELASVWWRAQETAEASR